MIKSFMEDEQGQGMTEYGIVIAFIAFGVFITIIALRENILEMFTKAKDTLVEGNEVLHP